MEHQVYRINHYTGRGNRKNILVFRFGNALFEPVWNRNHIFNMRLPEACENLPLAALCGDAALFTRRDGVEAQWRLIDPILEAWRRPPPGAFPNYAADSEVPMAADELQARNGHQWRLLDSRITNTLQTGAAK